MSADQSPPCPFRVELSAVIARGQVSPVERGGSHLYESLSALERRALVGGASDRTLRDIAEARFLSGILRGAVRPVRPAPIRTVLRARAAPRHGLPRPAQPVHDPA